MRLILMLFVCALALSPTCVAQLVPGQIGATSFSTFDFSVVDDVTGTSTNVNVGSFGGSGTSQSILWDPAVPDSFIVGGFGFVGRATLAGGTWTYSFIASVGTAAQMSFDATGAIIVADAGTDSLVSVDPNTGATTTLIGTGGNGTWGTSVNAGAVDPLSGDIYVGENGNIWRWTPGTATPLLLASGLGGFVSAIAFEPISGEVLATVLAASRLVRIDAAGTVTDLFTGGAGVSGPNALAVDLNGDYLVGGASRSIFRVPSGGGAATSVIAGFASAGTNTSGLSVVGVQGGSAQFQVNTANASLTINNVNGTPTQVATATILANTPVPFTLSTSVPGGALFDVAFAPSAVVPLNNGGFALQSGDLFNMNLLDPGLFFLNGAFAQLVVLPGTLSGQVSFPVPTGLSTQMLILNPAAPGSLNTSQPTRIEVL